MNSIMLSSKSSPTYSVSRSEGMVRVEVGDCSL